MAKDLIVKKSKIEGQGVFANRDFKEGEIITKWHTRQVTSDQLDKLSDEERRHTIYYEGKNVVMMGSPERYVNHSCDANTHAEDFCDVASRNIKKGEEVTANYSETMAAGHSMNCDCGSKNCRKIIKSVHD
jgi:SET domain-containing protein